MTKISNTTENSQGMAMMTTAVKKLGQFFACLIGTTAVCLSAYVFTVDNLIQDSNVPASYKWFLLQNIPGPRIIFESGSNSHHAINTDVISSELGMTAINIADNGGYALEDKVTRLETYARPGDVIVLPLEWTFYHREKLTDNYVETLFTSNRDYYRAMPPSKRVKRALSLPPKKIIDQISKQESRTQLDTESPAKDLFVAALTQLTGHQSRDTSIGPGLGVAEQSCDDYILGKAPQREALTLSDNIKPALKRLQKLKAKGINIHFAWPVLAGDGCLSDAAYVSGFRTDIENAVNHAGFEFMGTPGQSLYGQDVQDDSPYHLTTKGADIHTQQMIRFLKAQGYGTSATPLDIKNFARHRLLELELAAAVTPSLQTFPIDQAIAMDDAQMRETIEFTAGWWDFEPYGRWMRDNRAMLRITLPEDISENSALQIQGITKSGQAERVNVSINGQLISSAMFGESASLLVPVATLPRGEALSVFLTLPEAGVPQSPRDRGENDDARSMTLHLQTMKLISGPMPDTTAEQVISPPVSQTAKTPATSASPVITSVVGLPAGPTNNTQCIATDDIRLVSKSSVKFEDGWWDQEAFGRWMKGDEADFIMRLPSEPSGLTSRDYMLTLQGDFFRGRRQTVSLTINGEDRGYMKETADGLLKASFEAPEKAQTLTIKLRLSNPQILSPKALGLSEDNRVLTYFLKSVTLSHA